MYFVLHVPLDVFSPHIPLRCYQCSGLPQAEAGRQVLLMAGTPALCPPASLRAARLGRDSDPITRPGQVPSLLNSQQITWWHNDTHSLSSHRAQHPVSAPPPSVSCLISHGQYQPVFATLNTALGKTLDWLQLYILLFLSCSKSVYDLAWLWLF